MNIEIEALIKLHHSKLKNNQIKELLQNFSSASEALKQLNQPFDNDVTNILELIQRFNIRVVSFLDSCYPSSFFNLVDFPAIIYIQGHLIALKDPLIAIVGTRQHTLYGQTMAEGFSSYLSAQGCTIVSGLARGIDTHAHIGSIGNGKTIAILGSGLLEIYPKENCKLAEQIIDQGGCLISEHPILMKPQKYFFPQRNRLVAALSQAAVLIESPKSGGAMITMQKAWELRKKLFTIPGRVDMETFGGNHQLIKQQKACLVENPQEILISLGFKLKETNQKKFIELNEEEKFLLRHLSAEEKTIDELVLLTQYPIMKLNVLLTSLVLKKVLKEFPGKIFKKAAL